MAYLRTPGLQWSSVPARGVCSVPFQSARLHAGNYLYFWSSKLCSLECSEVMARTLPLISSEWNITVLCLWSFGIVPISENNQDPFVCFQWRHYRLPLRNMLECSVCVYTVEKLLYLGLGLTPIFTKRHFSERASFIASDRYLSQYRSQNPSEERICQSFSHLWT